MLRLYFNHAWGAVRTESRSFSAKDGAVVLAGTGEKSVLPLFGFQLPEEDYALAEWQHDGARLFPPPAAVLERKEGGSFLPVPADALQKDGARAFLPLSRGQTVRLREGDQVLTITFDLQKDRAGWDRQKAAFMLVFLVFLTIGLPLIFLSASPDPTLVDRALEEARVKQGLPAKPEPLNLQPVPDPDAATGDPSGDATGTTPPATGEKAPSRIVLPASVR
ncbi:MAG: hypothetical protein IRZ16_11820 [Myxococcaceae bacterium]|nr:hypothetical protein [Myxococcaceae bacterium]